MNNNNEENRSYPLSMITQMRKKDEKRKRILKIVLGVISFVLIFAIGFVSGFYYGKTGKINPEPAVATASPNAKTLSDNAANSDAHIKSDALDASQKAGSEFKNQLNETDVLNKLSSDFINKISLVCPEAKLSFAIKNIDTGKSVMHNNVQMNSASIIKLFIMETIYKEASAGTYHITNEKEELLFKMITDSDNEAANIFIDDFGGIDETRKIKADNTISQTIKASGYKFTEANRKMYNTTPPGGPTGYENYTCVEDIVQLMEGIYNKTLFDEPYNTKALELLKQQKRLEKIPARILNKYQDVTVANKTGELNQAENDAAIIMSDDFNLIFAVFIDGIPKSETQDYNVELHRAIRSAIADFSLEIVDTYKSNKF